MNLLLIINPRAGQLKVKNRLLEIIDIFNRAGYTVITHITECKGDGEVAVRKHISKIDLVVCCGGDGTFNETMSGVLKSECNVPIGYIPAGTTNDFATSIQLSLDIIQATKDIIEGEVSSLDVGYFNNRYFSYVASFGLFTKTSYTAPQSMKNILGHMAYILSGIQEISQLTSHHVCFELSSGSIIEDDFIFGAISNSTSVGGIITLLDTQVDLSDGLLELLLIRAPKGVAELTECIWDLTQKNYNSNMITFISTDYVKITADPGMDWTLDGEWEKGHSLIEVKCIGQAVKVIKKY